MKLSLRDADTASFELWLARPSSTLVSITVLCLQEGINHDRYLGMFVL